MGTGTPFLWINSRYCPFNSTVELTHDKLKIFFLTGSRKRETRWVKMLTVNCKHLNPPYFSLPTTFKLEFFKIFKDNLNFSPISAISFSSGGGGGLNDANWDFLSFVPRLSHPPLILFFSYISIYKVLNNFSLKRRYYFMDIIQVRTKYILTTLLPSIILFLG